MKTSRATIKRLTAIADRLPIVIPSVLIERLKPYGTKRFIKIAAPEIGNDKSGKAAIETRWQEHPYEPDDPSLQQWLRSGGNYGVVAGQNIIIIDIDDKETAAKLSIKTFTVRSGSGRGLHLLLRSDATENAVIISNAKNVGNVQVKTKYVVGAGSRHNTGGEYKIMDDAPIAYVSKTELETIFGDELHWTGQIRIAEERGAEETAKKIGVIIPIDKVIDITKLHQRGSEYQGSHPLHGSTSGTNLNVNLQKNTWHCWRCNSGGAALEWIAIEEGIIRCDESHPGALRDAKFIETLSIAKKRGFNVKVIDEEISPDVERFFEEDESGRKKFVPAYAAKELTQQNHYVTRVSDGMMFCYNPSNGIYEMNADVILQKQIFKKLGKHCSINRRREIEDIVRIQTKKNLPSLPEELIAVENGILNVYTRELKPFNPDYFIINALPVKYDVSADCAQFKVFIEEVVPPENDRKALQEFLGYCFSPDCRFEKALMLIGIGANGKSTMLKIWTALLGKENVSAVQLQLFSIDKFALAQLFGKMANFYAGLSNVALKEDNVFLELVSGDEIEAQHKFKDMFKFRSVAKLAFSCNTPPAPPKNRTAYFRRWIMVKFPKQFLLGDPHRNENLARELTTPTELSGILNWALDGLERLLSTKNFTLSKTIEDTEEQYTLSSDPLGKFVERYLVATFAASEEEIDRRTVYDLYVEFCKKHQLPMITEKSFSMHLREYIPHFSRRTTNQLRETVVLLRGIRLKTEEEIEEEQQ